MMTFYAVLFYIYLRFSFQPKQEAAPPSKVLHIRSVPIDANEHDISALGAAFGPVTNVLLMKSKGQAFLELADVECAKRMINFYTYISPTIHHQPVSDSCY